MGEVQKVNFGVVERGGRIITTSRKVAEVFGREHRDVLDSIRKAIEVTGNFAAEFSATNFIQSEYKLRGRTYPEYHLTKDGLVYTVMGFTGEQAAKFKVAYINEFNRMEEQLNSLRIARMEHPELTDAIQSIHEEPKHYHFSNEANMINKIVLGMNAKQFREVHGIKEGSIRPYLNAEQIKLIAKLQKYDTVLVETGTSYQERKKLLAEYHSKLTSIKLVGDKP